MNGPTVQYVERNAGIATADRTWDQILRYRGEEFFIGYLSRLMALHASASDPARALQVFDAVRVGIESLDIIKQRTKQ